MQFIKTKKAAKKAAVAIDIKAAKLAGKGVGWHTAKVVATSEYGRKVFKPPKVPAGKNKKRLFLKEILPTGETYNLITSNRSAYTKGTERLRVLVKWTPEGYAAECLEYGVFCRAKEPFILMEGFARAFFRRARIGTLVRRPDEGNKAAQWWDYSATLMTRVIMTTPAFETPFSVQFAIQGA